MSIKFLVSRFILKFHVLKYQIHAVQYLSSFRVPRKAKNRKNSLLSPQQGYSLVFGDLPASISASRSQKFSVVMMLSSINVDAVAAFIKNLKLPRNVDQFLESSKSDQLTVGGLAG